MATAPPPPPLSSPGVGGHGGFQSDMWWTLEEIHDGEDWNPPFLLRKNVAVEKVKHVEPCSVLPPKKKVPKISVPYGKIHDSCISIGVTVRKPSLKGSHSKSSNWWTWQPLMWQLSHKTHSMMCHHPKWRENGFRLLNQYCWWKKSCTTWNAKKTVNNRMNYLSTGAGFGASTNITIYNHQRVARTKDVNNDVWSSKNGLLLAVLGSIHLQVVQRKSDQDASW